MTDRKNVLRIIDEYNRNGHLLYLEDYPGAFARGKSQDQALQKIPAEFSRYHQWSGQRLDSVAAFDYRITQRQQSELAIEDADTGILFDSERLPLPDTEYAGLKALVLKSAQDFVRLYSSVPDKDYQLRESRKTFYGELPVTASAMYRHVTKVNRYYFAEIGISIVEDEDLLPGREQGFRTNEERADYADNTVYDGNDGEQWSLRKVLRRFIWHDAIHAKAMYRAAIRSFPECEIANPFCFTL